MNKEDYLNELEEIITDELYMGNSIDDLDTEIANNTWSISISHELAQNFTISELTAFIKQVEHYREMQIKERQAQAMLFYAWYDAQASILYFSLLTDYQQDLPFKAEYQTISTVEPIIKMFLESDNNQGYPIIETLIDDTADMSKDKPHQVYLKRIDVHSPID